MFKNAVLRVVQKADDAWRTGGRRMLAPCILDLFKHILEMVREDGETCGCIALRICVRLRPGGFWILGQSPDAWLARRIPHGMPSK